MRIAVVGGGVAGIVSAYLLQREHEVTLFEAGDNLGGHTNTQYVEHGPDAGTAVDTGFIVLNTKNYPTFHRFLAQLGVPVRLSDMSFSYYCERTQFQYAGTTLNGVFAQRKNIISPQFWKFLWELKTFCVDSSRSLAADELGQMRLADFVQQGNYSKFFINSYLLPMGAAIWSAPLEEIFEFPASTFVQFLRITDCCRYPIDPNGKRLLGASTSYVKKFREGFKGTIRLNSPVSAVRRGENSVRLVYNGGAPENFDAVVLAAHADQSLSILEDPSAEETRLLGAWSYERNYTVLHTDIRMLPPLRRAWASWNYMRFGTASGTSPVVVTYHMNRLQGLKTAAEYCVTLNCKDISDENIVYATNYTHPTYNSAAVATQPQLPGLQGVRRTYFCGSYFGFGFHEDAVKSGADVAKQFSIDF